METMATPHTGRDHEKGSKERDAADFFSVEEGAGKSCAYGKSFSAASPGKATSRSSPDPPQQTDFGVALWPVRRGGVQCVVALFQTQRE